MKGKIVRMKEIILKHLQKLLLQKFLTFILKTNLFSNLLTEICINLIQKLFQLKSKQIKYLFFFLNIKLYKYKTIG